MCPVCHDPLGVEVVVLPCGHPLCHGCTLRLLERSRVPALPRHPFRCPPTKLCQLEL